MARLMLMFITAGLLAVSASSYANPKKNKKKPDYNAAKKECLKENPALKAKALQKCIGKKRK